jgi:hypothetical protein
MQRGNVHSTKRWGMTKYFFDLITMESVHYDYSGQRFNSVERAREQAILIAMDLGCSQSESPPSLQVQVRDVVGRLLFAVPAPLTESLAA